MSTLNIDALTVVDGKVLGHVTKTCETSYNAKAKAAKESKVFEIVIEFDSVDLDKIVSDAVQKMIIAKQAELRRSCQTKAEFDALPNIIQILASETYGRGKVATPQSAFDKASAALLKRYDAGELSIDEFLAERDKLRTKYGIAKPQVKLTK